jgi:transcriptional regulator of heat shock response
MESKSIWQSIEDQNPDPDSNLKIEVNDNASLISKKIKTNKNSTEISIIGTKRMEYSQAVPILEYLEKLISEKEN